MGAGPCAIAADMPTTAAMAAPKAKHDEPLARCATSSSRISASYTLEVRPGFFRGPARPMDKALGLPASSGFRKKDAIYGIWTKTAKNASGYSPLPERG